MSYKNTIEKIKRYHQHLDGGTVTYDLAQYQAMVNQINTLTISLGRLSETELKEKSQNLIAHAKNKVSPDVLLVEAYALVKESIRRVMHIDPFDVQIIGAIVLHQGKLAQMQTGEGKTLTAVFSAYLNALGGNGVHILTFNDYLARRDAEWMGPVYRFLGLRIAFVQEGMSPCDRKDAYTADITYLTAKESGFDFLRDSRCYSVSDIVQRDFHYAIIDEADSILVDEARIPLLIAESSESDAAAHIRKKELLHTMSGIAEKMEGKRDFEYDEYSRNICLTEQGTNRVEEILQCGNLYDEKNSESLARLSYALHAQHLLHIDHDYIVRNGKIELVDDFTGRLADKRRWPDGLQAALEVKENLTLQSKGTILNSITIQHFLHLYPKICGMTATAQQAEEELREFYNLHIVIIPPNRVCIRKDYPDLLFLTKKKKQEALLKEIVAVHTTKRPILVGTRSIEESATLAQALQKQGVTCRVLNAKQDALEASIIAQAGTSGAITISTNMAGRGTDIRLGGSNEIEKKEVAASGGLYVIGTNKHESVRIDNQLRGRAGRQGDPGSSRFFISLEDDLFVKYRLGDLLPSGKLLREQDDSTVDNPIIKKEINRLQRIVEGQNLEIKITLYKYSLLLEQQRKIISPWRKEILFEDSISDFFRTKSPELFDKVLSVIGTIDTLKICRQIALSQIDIYWSLFLAEITDIREGIHLRRIGGQDPLFEFHKLSIEIFGKVQKDIEQQMILSFNAINIDGNTISMQNTGVKTPSVTWTYLINDNFFEESLGTRMLSNMGLSVGTLIAWPLILLYPFLKKIRRKKEG